jgi:agmatinase
LEVIQNSGNRIKTFFDADIKESLYNGVSWDRLCNQIVNEIPNAIYISFDIDGLDPKFCPNTGTPVPGGLESSQVVYLVKKLVAAGKRIIGFDLCEVSGNHEWDANVGSRILFELSNWMAVSQGKLKLRKTMI